MRRVSISQRRKDVGFRYDSLPSDAAHCKRPCMQQSNPVHCK
nr:MAG TPA: hypothetical protein [Caudoviricetes sp.]